MNLEVARSYSVRCWHTEYLEGQTGSFYKSVFITATKLWLELKFILVVRPGSMLLEKVGAKMDQNS